MTVNLEEIREMVEGGMSVTAIAEELELSASHVSKLISALGLGDAKTRRTALSRLSPEDVQRIISLYLDNAPVGIICTDWGLSYNALYKLLGDNGVELRAHSVASTEVKNQRMDAAVRMYEAGARLYDIEEETGIRQPQLHRELHKRKIPLRKTTKAVTKLGFDPDLMVDQAFSNPTAVERLLYPGEEMD